MIHPTVQLSADLYIHAAREAIWARFCHVTDWPRWRADITNARWVYGHTWQEGAQFTLQPVGSGAAQPLTFIIRMVVPADTTVWESVNTSQGMVYSLHLADQVGGCKATLRVTFHGWGSLLKRLTSAGEKAKVYTLLAALKAAVERPDARR
jgi:hypothetical protein